MTAIRIHPSELGYAFSYSETVDIIGWGRDPFLPTTAADGDPQNWYADGAARLLASGRMIEDPEKGLNFTDDVTSAVLALVDPSVVFLAERKEDAGLKRLTVHMGEGVLWGMTRNADGMFELTLYADMTAAVVACCGFLGLALEPTVAGTRIDTDQDALSEIHKLATSDQFAAAVTKLSALGASDTDAASITKALAEPTASGVLSVLYCKDNVAVTAEPFSVMTTAQDDTWIIFPPASLQGPMVLEQSSVSALTARVLVGIAARLPAAA